LVKCGVGLVAAEGFFELQLKGGQSVLYIGLLNYETKTNRPYSIFPKPQTATDRPDQNTTVWWFRSVRFGQFGFFLHTPSSSEQIQCLTH